MARDFNGTADIINPGDTTALPAAAPMTVGCWVNADSLASTPRHMISRGNTAANGDGWDFALITTTGHMRFGKLGLFNFDTTNADMQHAVGTWSYACAVVNSNTSVTFYKVTLDGVVTTQTNATGTGTWINTPNKCRIGCFGRIADSEFFDGKIAEVVVYAGDALTIEEVRALALFGPAAVGRNPDGYWPLWGADSPEPDYSGNAKNGTLTGTTAFAHPPQGWLGLPATSGALSVPAAPAGSGVRHRRMKIGIGLGV